MKLFKTCEKARMHEKIEPALRNENRSKLIALNGYLNKGYTVVCYPYEDAELAYVIDRVHLHKGHIVANNEIVIDDIAPLAIAPDALW